MSHGLHPTCWFLTQPQDLQPTHPAPLQPSVGPHSLPWAPGGCQRAGEAWCWAFLWGVGWRPSLSDKPQWAWLAPHDSGLTRPGSQTPGSGSSVLDCPSPIVSRVPSLGSILPRCRCRPQSPATLETLQRHKTKHYRSCKTDLQPRGTSSDIFWCGVVVCSLLQAFKWKQSSGIKKKLSFTWETVPQWKNI